MLVQANENLTFEAACIRLAAMVDKPQLEKLVEAKAEKLGKGRFLTSLNTARTTIQRETEEKTRNHVRKYENNFHLPCSKGCSTLVDFSDRDSNWYTEIYPVLKEAFKTWRHGGNTCP